MSIDISRYVNITSGVGGGAAVAQRQLIARFVTQSQYLPRETTSVFQATTAAQVLAQFNNDPQSQEYKRASQYFAFVSKNIKSPPLISFAKWDTTTVTPAKFVGNSTPKSLSAIKGLGATANFNLQLGTSTVLNVVFDPTNAAITSVAALGDQGSTPGPLTVALRAAATAASPQQPALQQANVTYDIPSNRFTITASQGVNNTGVMVITAGSTPATDAASQLGFLTGDIQFTAGQVGETAVQCLARTTGISDNFGSFAFIPALPNFDSTLPADQGNRSVDIASWNSTYNNKFIFSLPITQSAATNAWFTAHQGFAGLGVTLTDSMSAPYADSNYYYAQSPMEILAATDYNAFNSTQNFMFYQFAQRPPLVSDNTTADQMDGFRLNYIGQTMTAGQQLSFYQRGLLMGGSTAAVDMNTYSNEMWLKSAFLQQIMSMFLSLPKLSATNTGRGQILVQMQAVIDQALRNGTIAAGKTLNATQKAFITQVTGNDKAWFQVQTIGYWLDATIQQVVNSATNLTEYQFAYTLVYSKDDQVRKVIGSDILI